MLAAVSYSDCFFILVVAVVCLGGAAVTAYFRPSDRERLARIEQKLDLVLTHYGLDCGPPPGAKWQELAADPSRKIAAISAYREQHGVGLAEAKRAVEEYMQKA